MLRALHTGAGGVRAGTACGKPFTLVRVLVLNPENISLACSYIFWVWRGQNEQRTLDHLKIRLSHQISCKHYSRSMLRTFKYLKYRHNTSLSVSASHNKYFPSIGLSHWKLNFITPKTSRTSQRKACGCGKLPHDTRRVFLRMRVRTRQCEHSLFIHVWTFGAGPAVRACTRQCECTCRWIVNWWRVDVFNDKST